MKNCYAPAYWFVFEPSQAKERSSYDPFSRNRSDNTSHLGMKRPEVSFEVAIHNERGLRNKPQTTVNFERPTNGFGKSCSVPKTSLTRRSNFCGSSNSKTNSFADNR